MAPLLTLALVGCESLSAPAPPPDTPAARLTPMPVGGDNFTVSVPAGWKDRSTDAAEVLRFSSGGKPVLIINRAPQGPVRTNSSDVPASIAVVRLRDRLPDEKVVNYLKNFPGTTLTDQPAHYALGGDEGVFVTYEHSESGTRVRTFDFVIGHHNLTYEVFCTATLADFASAVKDANALIDSWTWRDGA